MTDAELRRLAERAIGKPECGTKSRDSFTDAHQARRMLAYAAPQTVLALLDRIDAVRALHVPASNDWCLECRQPWHCPTIRSLGDKA